MEKFVLKGVARSKTKKGANRKLRSSGLTPVICYGRTTEATSAAVDPAELLKILSTDHGPNLVFDLAIDNNGAEVKHEVMLRSIQRDPVTRRIIHADLYAIDAQRKVTVRVPIRLDGKAAGVGLGGKLRQAAREVALRCLPKDIPVVVAFDVSPMGLKERAQISQVPVPEGCEFIFDSDFLVAEIIPPRS
ncbi:MAG: 50S ribosomal protein L25 [Proteobacteria bacterium]|nr:50S ribosomal protein L25 [Pseudomonadota bacterium]